MPANCNLSRPRPEDCNLFQPGIRGAPPTFTQLKKGEHAYHTDWNNIAPNLGLTWRPNASSGWLHKLLGAQGDSVLRASFSRSYNWEGLEPFTDLYLSNPGITITTDRSATLGNLGALPLLLRETSRLGPPAFPERPAYPLSDVITQDLFIFDPHLKVPYADTWGAMEELQRAGLVKRIGVSNLNISLLRDLLAKCSIRPAVHQFEIHPYLAQPRQLRFCAQEKIAVTAFSPLGAPSYLPLGMATSDENVLRDPVVTAIATAHRKTPAQITLRWGVQRGCTVIPKTQTPARLAENLALFDFALTAAEMAAMDGLDRRRRFNDPGHFGEVAFNTFMPIFD